MSPIRNVPSAIRMTASTGPGPVDHGHPDGTGHVPDRAHPSYASIGLAAPILLVAARVLQGFSTGGEYAGAMTFIAEYAPDRRRGYFGSFLELGTFVGYALGATIASVLPLVLSAESMSSWGWRIPFFVALPLGIVGVYLRVKLEETPAFQTLLSESEEREGTQVKDGLKLIFTKYLPTFVMVGGVVVAWNVTNYMLTSYMPTYLETTVDQHGGTSIDSTTSSWLQIAVLWLAVFIIPLLGRSPTAPGASRSCGSVRAG